MNGDGLAIALVGATATGKTELGRRIAAATGAEIVCADARQLYRELELGTGKPEPSERARSPHHLFDMLGLGERTSAGGWARAARDVARAAWQRGSPVLFVGGSGLYVDGLLRGLSPEPPADAAVRARLRADMERSGPQEQHRRLAACDPATAARLAPGDRQRIVRALEVFEVSHRSLTDWQREPRRDALEARWVVLELDVPPALLDRRIADRTDAMLAAGLIEETRALVVAGHRGALAELRAIGYDECAAELAGQWDRAETALRISLRTRQLAKRQRTWFRHQLRAHRLVAGEHASADRVLAEALAAIQGDAPGHG